MSEENLQIERRAEKNSVERHVQTVLVSLITGAIIWIALNSIQYQSQMARVEEKMVSMAEKIDDLVALQKDVISLNVRVTVLEQNQKSD